MTHPQARFADLKPKNLDNNIFTYHLHQLMTQKLVIKNDDGLYELTSHGKFASIDTIYSPHEILELAYDILLLVVKDEDGRWLLRRRLSDPLFGLWGFAHAEPTAYEHTPETATRVLLEKTGLSATFTVKGSGYFRVKKGDDLESFTHFTLLCSHNVSGDLLESQGNGDNAWFENPDFSDKSMIPSTAKLAALSQKPNHFFIEMDYDIQT